VSGLFGVRVEALDEVVHHELEFLGRGCRDVHLVALFQQPLVGVHDLKVFCRVAGDDQDFGHGRRLLTGVSVSPASCFSYVGPVNDRRRSAEGRDGPPRLRR